MPVRSHNMLKSCHDKDKNPTNAASCTTFQMLFNNIYKRHERRIYGADEKMTSCAQEPHAVPLTSHQS